MLRLITADRVRPYAVVFNVNLKEFNAADSAYQTLYPALEQDVWADLDPADRALLKQTQSATTIDKRVDRFLAGFWALYGMRSDIRDALFGQADAASAVQYAINSASGELKRSAEAHVPSPDKFLGTYDLSALTDSNVEVVFLKRLGLLLRAEGIRAYAILTPQNHTLLHDYIDAPEYQAQLAYVRGALSKDGVRVLDYDHAFSQADFLDNDHLTAAANRRLASMLNSEIAL
jgi:hypothetical protein